MRALEKNIKGFNLLEVLIVIVIIGFISAVAYPNLSSWSKERKARGAAIKIKSLIEKINAQVQRGNYAFVQVFFIADATSVEVKSRGMKISTLNSKINDGGNVWNADATSRCNIISDTYWDDDPDEVDIMEVQKIELEDFNLSIVPVVGLSQNQIIDIETETNQRLEKYFTSQFAGINASLSKKIDFTNFLMRLIKIKKKPKIVILNTSKPLLSYLSPSFRVSESQAVIRYSFLSREFFMQINNVVLVSSMVIILWGTLAPIGYEVINGNLYSIGKPFFDFFFVPCLPQGSSSSFSALGARLAVLVTKSITVFLFVVSR